MFGSRILPSHPMIFPKILHPSQTESPQGKEKAVAFKKPKASSLAKTTPNPYCVEKLIHVQFVGIHQSYSAKSINHTTTMQQPNCGGGIISPHNTTDDGTLCCQGKYLKRDSQRKKQRISRRSLNSKENGYVL